MLILRFRLFLDTTFIELFSRLFEVNVPVRRLKDMFSRTDLKEYGFDFKLRSVLFLKQEEVSYAPQSSLLVDQQAT
jgi:hypothetical protein